MSCKQISPEQQSLLISSWETLNRIEAGSDSNWGAIVTDPESSEGRSEADIIDRLASEFERKWRQGEKPRVEDYLLRVDESLRELLLRELLLVESQLRKTTVSVDLTEPISQAISQTLSAKQSVLDGDSDAKIREQPGFQDKPALPASFPNISISGLTFLETLGDGAFGKVVRAHHLLFDLDVAVKLINVSTVNKNATDAVLQEARLMARLDHPNLLRIFEAGKLHDVVYFVLEIMDGGSCKSERRLTPSRAISISKQLLSGLQALHDARIIHRDIKPANILQRASDGRVKLADLGLAIEKVPETQDQGFAGTIPFMAPELFRGQSDYNILTDIYALGMSLACMFLARDPFPNGSFNVIRDWVLNGERPHMSVERPDLPSALSSFVDSAIAVNVEERPKNTAAVLKSLGRIEPYESSASNGKIHLLHRRNDSVARNTSAKETICPIERIGVWEIGESVFRSSNWDIHSCTHSNTGRAARFAQLRIDGPLSEQTDSILSSAERASRFKHSHVVSVVDWGVHQSTVFIVTESHGRMLGDLAVGEQSLEAHVLIKFLATLANGLAYLHERNSVYQVFDPTVAVVSSDARYALLSWPIFCVEAGSKTRDIAGKPKTFFVPLYAAPEVLFQSSTTIEKSSDVYGLGAVAARLLVGEHEYNRIWQRTKVISNIRLDSTDATAPLRMLIGRMINADPTTRPSAEEVRDELVRIGVQIGIEIPGLIE